MNIEDRRQLRAGVRMRPLPVTRKPRFVGGAFWAISWGTASQS
jgi:hypothetical protein